MASWNFHTYKDSAGERRWTLTASNGKTVADSGEGYSSLYECRQSAERMKQNVAAATVD